MVLLASEPDIAHTSSNLDFFSVTVYVQISTVIFRNVSKGKIAFLLKEISKALGKYFVQMHGKKHPYLSDTWKMRFHTFLLAFFPTISTFSLPFLKHTTQIFVTVY